MSQAGTLSGASSVVPPTVATSYVTNSGTAVPALNVLQILGASVAAGSTPVSTSGATNVVTVKVQTSQAIASTDATKIGLSAFNSAQFSVDANGFVSLSGGSPVDSITAGTNINLTGTAANPIVNLNDPILLQNDSAAAPGYSFASSANSGWFYDIGFPGPALAASGVEIAVANLAVFSALRSLQVGWQFLIHAVGSAVNFVDPSTDTYVGITSTAAVRTVTLPATPSDGVLMIVKDESGAAATNNITVNTSDGTLIDGNATAIINQNYGSLSFIFRNGNWWII